jgi:hypothetical protein
MKLFAAVVVGIILSSPLWLPDSIHRPPPALPARVDLPNRMELNINGKSWVLYDVEKETDKSFKEFLEMKHAQATTDCDHNQILYTSTSTDLRNTLWHEIFHAGACPADSTYWNSKSDDDHQGIYKLASFIEGFTRSNPEFLKWETQ